MDGRQMHRQTQGKIMLLSHTLTIRGSDVASLEEFGPVNAFLQSSSIGLLPVTVSRF